MTRTSAIVLGGGAIGLASAYHLRRDGWDVTLVDAHAPGDKASGHNAGWVIPSMSVPVTAPGVIPQALKWMSRRDGPVYVSPSWRPEFLGFMARMAASCTERRYVEGSKTLAAMSATALSSIDDLRAEGVEFEMHDDPLTMLFTDQEKLHHRIEELRLIESELTGFSWREMDPGELGALAPAVTSDVVAAIESKGDRSLDPRSFVLGLAEACAREGVDLRYGNTAALVPADAGRARVVVGREVLEADKVVVAAGAWTNEVLRPLGEKVAVQAGKGYGYDLPRTADAPTGPIYLAEGKVAITPLESMVRVSGTMGFGGLDESIDTVRAGGMISSLHRYFANWPAEQSVPSPWTGLRPMTPDGVPVIGALPAHPHVIVASGHVMLGISLASVTGRLVTDLAGGRAAGDLFDRLSPQRF
ncbi:D-amino-acid dehydrogenase [Brevibacterium sanguinis]|uniref:D-amino-acid dehydrogenase n=2 Tax=Brevibacterium TaxID=1696 RepID=A0A366INV1_9MICO|nr:MULTISPECIES: FAD-dependent oxidoreductase [Brevibacterium]RBP68064.1 D-amino-acid dehydrogenase [Brevibacterium sanguinis]RBP74519.1 D-amino-acid dehydrogenase [Brevibacterium celere]